MGNMGYGVVSSTEFFVRFSHVLPLIVRLDFEGPQSMVPPKEG